MSSGRFFKTPQRRGIYPTEVWQMFRRVKNWLKKNGKKLAIAGVATAVAVAPMAMAAPAQAADQTVGGTAEKLGVATVYNVAGFVTDPFCGMAKGYDQWAGKSTGCERVVRGTFGAAWGAASTPFFQWLPRGARLLGDVLTCWQNKKQYSLKPCEAAPEYKAWVEATVLPF